jgi:integrase
MRRWRRSDFPLAPPYPFVQLATTQTTGRKSRQNTRTCAHGQLGASPGATFRYKLCRPDGDDGGHEERRNKRTDRTENACIWDITNRRVRTWLSEAVEAVAADGGTFSVPVTPHTFRHSYAMHTLYAGIPLMVLQSLMGHKSVSSTEVYMKVFALDVAARHRVQFQMQGADAVAMLKGNV